MSNKPSIKGYLLIAIILTLIIALTIIGYGDKLLMLFKEGGV